MRAVTEKRVLFRGRTLKSGFIVLGQRAPRLECTVRNFSNAGAALRVSTTFGLPQHFDLVFEGIVRHCRSQWRNDNRIGVVFESV
ncbi:MAG TPA: PilZ domain-containing protein [Pseudolabrys sp.]|nr:PilZ domain-containing protein [Pseudolabrys sp.]